MIKDDVMDAKLNEFLNTYYITDNTATDISIKFLTLPLKTRLKIFEEYLLYFFTHAMSINAQRNFTYHDSVDSEAMHMIELRKLYNNLYFREFIYKIDTKNGSDDEDDIDDSFNINIQYDRNGAVHKLVSFVIWVSYDAFETSAIGFSFLGNYDDNIVREKLKEVLKRVYDKIMSDDTLHLWYMMGGMEDTLRKLLLDF